MTLNPPFAPDPALTLREFEYSHPLQDGPALRRAVAVRVAARPAPHLVRGGLARPRLPRGRPEVGACGRRRHRAPRGSFRADAGARTGRRLSDRCTPHATATAPHVATPVAAPRALSVAMPAIIHGEVTHRRSRPARHAFTYPAFCMRLPLSQLATIEQPRHRAQPARRRVVPRPRSRPLRRQPAPALDSRAARRRGCRRRRRDRAARVSAHAGLRVQSGELLGLPRPGRRRARRAVRSAQHVRRAPPLPAGECGWRAARQRA